MNISGRTKSLFSLSSRLEKRAAEAPEGPGAQPVCATACMQNVDFDFYDAYTKNFDTPADGAQAHFAYASGDDIVTSTFWASSGQGERYFADVLSLAVQGAVGTVDRHNDYIRKNTDVLGIRLGGGAASFVMKAEGEVSPAATFLRTTSFWSAGSGADGYRELVWAVSAAAGVDRALDGELLLHATLYEEGEGCKIIELWRNDAARERFAEERLQPALHKLLAPDERPSVVSEQVEVRVFWVSGDHLNLQYP